MKVSSNKRREIRDCFRVMNISTFRNTIDVLYKYDLPTLKIVARVQESSALHFRSGVATQRSLGKVSLSLGFNKGGGFSRCECECV